MCHKCGNDSVQYVSWFPFSYISSSGSEVQQRHLCQTETFKNTDSCRCVLWLHRLHAHIWISVMAFSWQWNNIEINVCAVFHPNTSRPRTSSCSLCENLSLPVVDLIPFYTLVSLLWISPLRHLSQSDSQRSSYRPRASDINWTSSVWLECVRETEHGFISAVFQLKVSICYKTEASHIWRDKYDIQMQPPNISLHDWAQFQPPGGASCDDSLQVNERARLQRDSDEACQEDSGWKLAGNCRTSGWEGKF